MEENNPERSSLEDLLLGEIAVARGHLTRDQLQECLEEQERLRENGNEVALGQILIDRKQVDAETLSRLLMEQRNAGEPIPRLSRYDILERLGAGASALVFRARDRQLGRTVALKVLRSELGTSEKIRLRFQREGQVAAGLSHPNVVAVHDVGESEGQLYLVMELVEGAPLSELLAKRTVELRTLAHLLEKAARGVAAAHEKGVVHRDLKPSNILVGRDGEPKVGDFGLAHLLESDTILTRTGTVLGTPLHMAPEQVRGRTEEITPRTDVYALGTILYEILIGRPPHVGESATQVFDKIIHEEPILPRKFDRRVDRDLETICMKALEKSPGRRYASAAEFADDLQRRREGESILAKPAGPVIRAFKWTRRHRVSSAVAAVVAVGLLGLGGTLLVRSLQFRRQIEDLLSRATNAEREERYSDAGDLYLQVRAMWPGHPVAERKLPEMREAAGRAAAARYVRDGREAERSHRQLGDELARLEERLKQLEGRSEPSSADEQTQALWDLEREIEVRRQRRADLRAEMLAAYARAIGAHPKSAEAARFLAEFYWTEFLIAERAGDRERAAEYRQNVLLYDQESKYRDQFDAGGTVALASIPSGAEVYAFRYEEGHDRRRMPRPFNVARGESRPPAMEENVESAYALEFSPFNRAGASPFSATVPPGSYVFVLRLPGRPETRYPVFVRRGTRREETVRIYTEAEIGKGFVFVPAGRFIMGGDPDAPLGVERDEDARLPDFFISKFEVTRAEYQKFIEELAHADLALARKRLLRHPVGKTDLWRIDDAGRVAYVDEGATTLPALGVSWEDANEYARWMTREARARGDPATYRLPTNAEWEKASRGADGRFFPWGDHFHWTFVKGFKSRPGKPAPEPIGAFAKDESPYGVRDLAGSAREWCDDWFDEKSNLKHVRGGSWGSPAAGYYRSARRGNLEPADVDFYHGFRLVRIPPP